MMSDKGILIVVLLIAVGSCRFCYAEIGGSNSVFEDGVSSDPFGPTFCMWCPIVINTIDFGFNHQNWTDQIVQAMDVLCRLIKLSSAQQQQCLDFVDDVLPEILATLTPDDMKHGFKVCHLLFNCSTGPFDGALLKRERSLNLYGGQSDKADRGCNGCIVGAVRYAETLLGLADVFSSGNNDLFENILEGSEEGKEDRPRESIEEVQTFDPNKVSVYGAAQHICQELNMCKPPTEDQMIETSLIVGLAQQQLIPLKAFIPTFSNCYNCQLGMGSVVLIIAINETFYMNTLTSLAVSVCNQTVNGTTIDPCQLSSLTRSMCFVFCHGNEHCIKNITIPPIPYHACTELIHQYIQMFFNNILFSLEPYNFCSYNGFCNATSPIKAVEGVKFGSPKGSHHGPSPIKSWKNFLDRKNVAKKINGF